MSDPIEKFEKMLEEMNLEELKAYLRRLDEVIRYGNEKDKIFSQILG